MLRHVLETDLPTFFAHQQDPEAIAMAGFPARDWDAFVAHWRQNVLGNATGETRTIVVDDRVAGYVASWEQDGRRLIAYWIGKEHWGRGVARTAVDEFLTVCEGQRPIYAHVVTSNARSIRVLEKCGFQRADETTVGADGIAEALYHIAE